VCIACCKKSQLTLSREPHPVSSREAHGWSHGSLPHPPKYVRHEQGQSQKCYWTRPIEQNFGWRGQIGKYSKKFKDQFTYIFRCSLRKKNSA
jgi:hypothetical protein